VIRARSAVFYYLAFTLIAVLWAIIGALKGNPDQAVIEAVIVYCLYMWTYAILILHLSNNNYQDFLLPFFSFAAVSVSAFCFYVLFDYLFGLNWLGERVKEEMYLHIGVHDGFVRMNNVNVGMFCFLVPYLLASIIMKGKRAGRFAQFAFVISVLGVVLASRRIVFVLVLLTPALTYLICRVSYSSQRGILRRTIGFYSISAVFLTVLLFGLYQYNSVIFDGFTNRVLDVVVVDEQSPRQVQHVALVEGFLENPYVGSGFGGLTDVVRSEERPWTYELTYSKILFNSGIFGTISLVVFFALFTYLAILKMRKTASAMDIYVPLLVGFFSVLIAAASNPYLSSFDFIFVFSIIPLILNSQSGPHRPVREEAARRTVVEDTYVHN
jgi:hypothetical protein